MVGNSGKRWKRTKQPVFPTDTFNIFAIKLEHPHPYKHWRYLHEFSSLYFWKQTMCKLKKQNKHHDLQCKTNEPCETEMIKYDIRCSMQQNIMFVALKSK